MDEKEMMTEVTEVETEELVPANEDEYEYDETTDKTLVAAGVATGLAATILITRKIIKKVKAKKEEKPAEDKKESKFKRACKAFSNAWHESDETTGNTAESTEIEKVSDETEE